MQNQYLEVLELSPGASKAQIKSAYRRLSKVYHPDVSKDENAREKFIEINEAYKFLTDVGPRPSTIQSSAPAYDYDVQDHAYDDWRRRAKAYARKKAREAELRQIELIKYSLQGINVFVAFVAIFNILLIIDSQVQPEKFSEYEFVEKEIRFKRERYTDVIFSNHTFRLMTGGISVPRGYQGVNIFATPILNVPVKLEVIGKDCLTVHIPEYNVLIHFRPLILALMLLVFLYQFASQTMDTKLTFGIFVIFIECFQLYLYFKL
ncbi:J domain-containing protein [Reichenbachiella sp.]|uniref:J domain-containing protein n=1 Tax=Reichenbachiella sp. TaxID=2184521 RepID=UPI003B5C5D01